jgi:hypothetical protein
MITKDDLKISTVTKDCIAIHTCTPCMYLRRTYLDMSMDDAVNAFLEKANELNYGMKVHIHIDSLSEDF